MYLYKLKSHMKKQSITLSPVDDMSAYIQVELRVENLFLAIVLRLQKDQQLA